MSKCPHCGQKMPEGNTLFEGAPKSKSDVFSIPDWIPMEEWKGWLAMRVKMKKPATELAQRYAIEDLQVLRIDGENIKEIMRKAIVKNWLSFYAINNRNGNGHQAPPEDALARERRKEAERKRV